MSSTNTTTITSTSSSALGKHEDSQSVTTATPQTNGITDTRVDVYVDNHPVTNSTTTKDSQQSSVTEQIVNTVKIHPSFPHGESIDPSSQTPSIPETSNSGPGPLPNFRVEGSGRDSSVTVGILPQECCSGCSSGGGTGPSSEDMKLSLVSWYSEPGEERLPTSSPTCCESGSGINRQTLSLTNSLISKGNSEEKENQTPEPTSESCLLPLPLDLELNPDLGGSKESVNTLQGEEPLKNNVDSPHNNRHPEKMHVKLLENGKNCLNSTSNPKSKTISCDSLARLGGGRPECSKCCKRSKSGHVPSSTTPTSTGRSRTPASRRLMPSSKSSSEVKKPIKSILKADSHSRSGSGSDNKSSVDSLVDNRIISEMITTTPLSRGSLLISRSEGSTRAKFNLNHQIFTEESTVVSSSDRITSKFKRIEKYATLTFRRGQGQSQGRVKSRMELGSDPNIGGGEEATANGNCKEAGSKVSISTPIDPFMTKSMSFLEKRSGDHSSLPYYEGHGGATTTGLKRQGSLRLKKGNSPQWEPCTTKTTLLRMQKMQEVKAKQGQGQGGGVINGGSGYHTGSTHSGSGESIHQGHGHSHSAPSKQKVFAKLSSAMGQTASSNQKRLKQDKSVQTDVVQMASVFNEAHGSGHFSNGFSTSMSPIPSVDTTEDDLIGQIKHLEKLANRYRGTAQRFQYEYEKSEAKITDLTKQLQEIQIEDREMIEFLQAEKSTLAESLAETEIEAKKWRDQSEVGDTRLSILARLGEGHKQEAKKSAAQVQQLEAQSNAIMNSISNQISDGKNSILTLRKKVTSLTKTLMHNYSISKEALCAFADSKATAGQGNSATLLNPLIESLGKAFPTSSASILAISDVKVFGEKSSSLWPDTLKSAETAPGPPPSNTEAQSSEDKDNFRTVSDREVAKDQDIGLDQIILSQLISSFPEVDDELYLSREVLELDAAVGRLLLVVRVIVVQCNVRVSSVAMSILECLESEDDQGSRHPELAEAQKSLVALRNGSFHPISQENGLFQQNGNISPPHSKSHAENGESDA